MDEISYLVSQTFKHHEENFEQESTYLDEPGLLYCIEKKTASFMIHCLFTDNMAEEMELIEQIPQNYSMFPEGMEIKSFACDYKAGRYLETNLTRKRFYLETESLSEPTDHWWLIEHPEHFEISFSYKRRAQAIQLGPLGDAKKVLPFLKDQKELFKRFFDFPIFLVSDDSFKFQIDKSDDLQSDFMNLFQDGSWGEDLDELSKLPGLNPHIRAFFQTLKSMSAVRNFWKSMNTR